MLDAVGDGFGLHEGAPDGAAQVRRIKTAENAVPVGVVALPAEQKPMRLRSRALRTALVAILAVSEARARFSETRSIFLCIRFDSEYLAKKPRHSRHAERA